MSDAERRVRAEWPRSYASWCCGVDPDKWIVWTEPDGRRLGCGATVAEAWEGAASRDPGPSDADRLAEVLALLREARPMVVQCRNSADAVGLDERAAEIGGLLDRFDAVLEGNDR